jgi:hypothetical protein
MAAAAITVVVSVPINKQFIVSSTRRWSWQRGAVSRSVLGIENLHDRKHETALPFVTMTLKIIRLRREKFSNPNRRSVGIGPELWLDVSGVMVDDV